MPLAISTAEKEKAVIAHDKTRDSTKEEKASATIKKIGGKVK